MAYAGEFREAEKTVRVEYDATRFTRRGARAAARTGVDIVEELALVLPPAPAPAEAVPVAS